MKRAKKSQRKLKTQLRAVITDILRKTTEKSRSKKLCETLEICIKILNQKRTDKNKVYSVHEPHIECIAKGKAHKNYEFGNKVSVTSSTKGHWVLEVMTIEQKVCQTTIRMKLILRAQQAALDELWHLRRITQLG